MDYREERSYRITILNHGGHDSRGCVCDSDTDQSQINLQSKEQSANIKEKLERENVISTKQCIRSD